MIRIGYSEVTPITSSVTRIGYSEVTPITSYCDTVTPITSIV